MVMCVSAAGGFTHKRTQFLAISRPHAVKHFLRFIAMAPARVSGYVGDKYVLFTVFGPLVPVPPCIEGTSTRSCPLYVLHLK